MRCVSMPGCALNASHKRNMLLTLFSHPQNVEKNSHEHGCYQEFG